MFFRNFLLVALLACTTYAIEVKSSYGPPPQHLPHRQYGVPQQIPFPEYGPPALEYGPPKLNFIGGSGSSSGLHEHIKNYYGAPKRIHEPLHKVQQQYVPSALQYVQPTKPGSSNGATPLKLQKPTLPSKALHLFPPAPQFSPGHQPASSYGPPPSGPLNIPPKKIFGPPPPNYGPLPLPNFNPKPETTIILTAEQNVHNQQDQQVQIQNDARGQSNSVARSQSSFHTACDGWKPIPAPAGFYVENNRIETQTGYRQVTQAQTDAFQSSSFLSKQYSGGANTGIISGGLGATFGGSVTESNSIIDGLSDEQLVAVALQSSNFDADNSVEKQNILAPTGTAGDFNKHNLNSIETEALQLSLGSLDESYSKPLGDSFAPGSKYAPNQQSSSYSRLQGNFGISGPGGNFGPPPPPNGKYGSPLPTIGNYKPPSTGNYGPPSPTKGNYAPPPPTPNSIYGSYLSPPRTANYGPPTSSAPSGPTFGHHQIQANLGIQYGTQSGKLRSFPPHSGVQPSKPVSYRTPVPPGLFQTIGATVQHLDKFGVKPQLQATTYISPAANELPQTAPGNLNIEYGTPHQMQQQEIPQYIIEQQLPQQRQPQVYVQIEQQQNGHQEEFGNAHPEYSAASLPPLIRQGPPVSQYIPHLILQQQPTGNQQTSNGVGADIESATTSFDNTAFASNQFNRESVHIQALPLQQEQPRFHDCGQGPNLVGGGTFNYEQQAQEQYSTDSGTSIAQSIPLSEQQTQFLSGPATSYGPPPSGGNELDNIGYASEKSQVTALPNGKNPEGLAGLDGLNVLSAQNSQAIHFRSQETKNGESYQIKFGRGEQQQTVNHEEILSVGLLQTILNAVEQPEPQHQPLPANHKAESRSDIYINVKAVKDENESGVAVQESRNVEIQIQPDDENTLETDANV